MALIWKFYNAVCTATSTFDKWHDIRCLRAEFTAKHGKAPLSLTTRWWMEPDLGSWQSPAISRSHLYRGTIAWTPPTAIYRAYTVRARLFGVRPLSKPVLGYCWLDPKEQTSSAPHHLLLLLPHPHPHYCRPPPPYRCCSWNLLRLCPDVLVCWWTQIGAQ